MASIKELKKEINNRLGEILDQVETWQQKHPGKDQKKADQITDDTINVFDDLIEKVNDKTVENRKKYLKEVHKELNKKSDELTERVQKL